MLIFRFFAFFITVYLLSWNLSADEFSECFFHDECCNLCQCNEGELSKKQSSFRGHIFTLGPEFYHVKRTRAGGTHQRGEMIGVRATYDHIKRYRIYWGADALLGTGILRGRTGGDQKIRSRLTDAQVEANLGYTLGCKNWPHFLFTLYGGYGYLREKNKFLSPSPLPITFDLHSQYASFGFLSNGMVSPFLKIGLNARFKALWNPRCKVTGDPDFDRINQLVGDRFHYRIELPLTYCYPVLWHWLEVALVPFYEKRVYGGRENFPFDFFKTKLMIYGVNLQLIYQF